MHRGAARDVGQVTRRLVTEDDDGRRPRHREEEVSDDGEARKDAKTADGRDGGDAVREEGTGRGDTGDGDCHDGVRERLTDTCCPLVVAPCLLPRVVVDEDVVGPDRDDDDHRDDVDEGEEGHAADEEVGEVGEDEAEDGSELRRERDDDRPQVEEHRDDDQHRRHPEELHVGQEEVAEERVLHRLLVHKVNGHQLHGGVSHRRQVAPVVGDLVHVELRHVHDGVAQSPLEGATVEVLVGEVEQNVSHKRVVAALRTAEHATWPRLVELSAVVQIVTCRTNNGLRDGPTGSIDGGE